ncbi:MAG TPA: DUF4331 family protein [bacterium]|nr:DUF4331 family protein [bacterium]
MKTNVLIPLLAAATLAVGAAACASKKSDGSGPPHFQEPPATLTQIDRMGHPALNTVIHKVLDTSGSASDIFNNARPQNDVATFGSGLTTVLALLHGCPAPGLGAKLLPDVLTFNTTSNANYARLNGRALPDDVFDITLHALWVNSAGTPCVPLTFLAGDHIGANDVAFGGTFPFLAAPH